MDTAKHNSDQCKRAAKTRTQRVNNQMKSQGGQKEGNPEQKAKNQKKDEDRFRSDVRILHVLQHTATLCNTLQYTATRCNTQQHAAIRCDMLQHAATCCNTLQHTATHCYQAVSKATLSFPAHD